MKINILFALSIWSFAVSCSKSDYAPGGGSEGQGGSMARFTISGDYMYTVDSEKLKTFDLSTPEHPAYLSGKDQKLGFDIETIFTVDTLLFIGSQNGMYIFDITNPGFPQELSRTQHITSCDPVVASGDYAYVTLNSESVWCGRTSNLLLVYNISDPYHPTMVYEMSTLVAPRGLGVDGQKLFICDKGIKVFDLANPERPRWYDDLSHIPEASGIDSYDVIPVNGLLLVTGADGLYQFDYTGEKLAYVSKIEVKRD